MKMRTTTVLLLPVVALPLLLGACAGMQADRADASAVDTQHGVAWLVKPSAAGKDFQLQNERDSEMRR
jgi:hypothetical protein